MFSSAVVEEYFRHYSDPRKHLKYAEQVAFCRSCVEIRVLCTNVHSKNSNSNSHYFTASVIKTTVYIGFDDIHAPYIHIYISHHNIIQVVHDACRFIRLSFGLKITQCCCFFEFLNSS